MTDSNTPVPSQLTFELPNLTLTAQVWGPPDGLPVLALHGWLDNSASFYRLAPLLTGCRVVALDMAGHGRSQHRSDLQPYNIWPDVGEVFAVADQLGWRRFALLGHSRGAIISMLCAGTFPERITHLALLDGIFPQPVAAEEAPEQLARSIRDCRRRRRWPLYETREEMIRTRMEGVWTLSRASAEALIARGTDAVDGGYRWSADPLLRAASAVRLSQEHLQAFAGRVQAPLSLFRATRGALSGSDASAMIGENCQTHDIAGGHHCHMEEQAGDIAAELNRFFASSVNMDNNEASVSADHSNVQTPAEGE
ncbi:alpha/beta fold hydrolase [Pseudomaricurvus sp. HS19]|uniref:alpha/beta fold hydrolase n=1 Tax=Pseudomaricurvus sp. HS19 TaxID=2692626 RepID=UPI0013693794|nr:alpha/beta hydrolase [Pseudomaricurvus sp. HS19]MYM62741.1 alpha/beta fold hydrolase [Pseudomaricurvus sp. HS19]